MGAAGPAALGDVDRILDRPSGGEAVRDDQEAGEQGEDQQDLDDHHLAASLLRAER
jgi:hypothetical protein